MAGASKIEWTEATWNPIAGCSVVSPGCTNCYAMRRVAPRLSANPATPHYAGTVQPSKGGPVWTGKIGIAGDSVLLAPLRWKKSRMIFVNSTSDLFHPEVPDAVIDRVFAVMALCPQHTFQVLTKRPERMREYLTEQWQPAPARTIHLGGEALHLPAETRGEDRRDQVEREIEDLFATDKALKRRFADVDNPDHWTADEELKATRFDWPLPNVWLGTSVEDQVRADERIPHLLATPAAVRFISAEPLLGPIDLIAPLYTGPAGVTMQGYVRDKAEPDDFRYWAPKLDWVIAGGESGTGARPMHPDWARALRDQCADAEVPFFFKQWGEWIPVVDRERDDPDWRFDYRNHYPDQGKTRWLNLAGGRGFHGERFHVMHLEGKHVTGRVIDGMTHNGMPAVQAGRGPQSGWANGASAAPLGQSVGHE